MCIVCMSGDCEENPGFPRTGVSGSWDLSCVCWGPNPGPPQVQSVTAGPFLQPWEFLLSNTKYSQHLSNLMVSQAIQIQSSYLKGQEGLL